MCKYLGHYASGSIRNPQQCQPVLYVASTPTEGASPQTKVQGSNTVIDAYHMYWIKM